MEVKTILNLGKYNLLRFNIPSTEGDELRLAVTMSVAFRAMAGSGENIHETVYAAENLLARQQGAAGVLEAAQMAAATGAKATGYTAYLAHHTLGAAFGGAANVVSESWIVQTLAASMGAQVRMGGDVWQALAFEGLMDAALQYGARVFMAPALCDAAFRSQVTTRRFLLEEAIFDILLGPGSVLVIDSDAYTVTLDGEDVIAAQEGAWLRLTRDVEDVALDVGRGRAADLQAQVSYPVRWL